MIHLNDCVRHIPTVGTAEAAERALRHEFSILGSAPVENRYGMTAPGFEGGNYSDPTVTYEGAVRTLPAWHGDKFERCRALLMRCAPDYRPIDWAIDLKSGARLEMKPATELKFGVTDGVDVKTSADLSRCYHFLPLAKAYRDSGNMAYRNEIVAQTLDWLMLHPYGWGAGWRANMNVAIRCVNWLAAYALIRDSFDAEADGEFLALLEQSLTEHRRYISSHLEFTEEPTALHPNHYVANLCGLLCVSAALSGDPESIGWEKLALREMRVTLDWQILPDGCDFEEATMYHGLVLEMACVSLLMTARMKGCRTAADMRAWLSDNLGENLCGKLHRMFVVLRDFTFPDGTLPVVGDADSGRMLELENNIYAPAQRLFLNALGAALFEDAALLTPWNTAADFAYPAALMDGVESAAYTAPASLASAAYPDGGFYILRGTDHALMALCMPIGTAGRGAHTHNDRLSFILNVRGNAVVTDPGVYTYTANRFWRNMLRDSTAHATVTVGDEQPNRLNPPGCFWGYHDDTQCRLIDFTRTEDGGRFVGEHYAYRRLETPLTHRRTIETGTGRICVRDEFLADGEIPYAAVFTFPLAPGVQVSAAGNTAQITAGDVRIAAEAEGGAWEISSGIASPEYGMKLEIPLLRLTLPRTPASHTVTFTWR